MKIRKQKITSIILIIALVLFLIRFSKVLLLPYHDDVGLENAYSKVEDIYLDSDYILIGYFNGEYEEVEVDLDNKITSNTIYRLQEFEVTKVLKGPLDSTTIKLPDLFISEIDTLNTIVESDKHNYIEMKKRYPGECIIFVDKREGYDRTVYVPQNSFQSILSIQDEKILLENKEQLMYIWFLSKNHLIKKLEALNSKYDN